MGQWVVYTKQADAQALCDALNLAAGYPRRGTDPQGKPVGPETYSPGAYGWTAGYAPTLSANGKRWGVAVAEQDESRAANNASPDKATKDLIKAIRKEPPLPSDWDDPGAL